MSIRMLNTLLLVVWALASVAAGDRNALTALVQNEIAEVHITLEPWGSHLGFAADIAGDDPRLAPLIEVIKVAEPASDHKCANRGAIRFELSDGRTIAIGLLPGHEEGFYGFRLYGDARLDTVYSVHRVRRDTLLAVLGELGVPVDGPAFPD